MSMQSRRWTLSHFCDAAGATYHVARAHGKPCHGFDDRIDKEPAQSCWSCTESALFSRGQPSDSTSTRNRAGTAKASSDGRESGAEQNCFLILRSIDMKHRLRGQRLRARFNSVPCVRCTALLGAFSLRRFNGMPHA